MPVHFKGKSEYDRNFKWLDSYRSKSFKPSPEQMAPSAGCCSVELGVTMEPPLQRKKHCPGPPTTLSTDFNQFPDSASDDFALLGRNDKFSENVRYKSKGRHSHQAREASPPKQQKLQEKENLRKPVKETPAPFVDTSKFRQRSKAEDQPRKPKAEDPPSTPLTPRKEKNEHSSLLKEVALKDKEAALREKFIKLDKEAERKKPRSQLKETRKDFSKTIDQNKMESAVKAWAKDKDVGAMNEFAQTNLDKGVVYSAPEAPADYSLRYKTGVTAPRQRRHKFSEYQKAFSWKDGSKASPVLAAEQAVVASESKNKVVYNSNPALIPPKKTFVKDSEYAAQFKEYSSIPVSSDDLKAVPRMEKQRSKVRRSKSTGSLRVDKRPPAGSSPVISPDNKRQTIESELQGEPKEAPSPPPLNQGKLKRPRSEYATNFRSPTKYQYDGVWHGALPPHLQPTKALSEEEKSVKESAPVNNNGPALSNWFAEVIELRQKAAEYKKRAQGTHFSREHLVQLIAQQTQAWDSLSTARSGSSTLSALSLESGLSARERAKEMANRNGDDISMMAHEGSDEEAGKPDFIPEKHLDLTATKGSKQRKHRKKAWQKEEAREADPDNLSLLSNVGSDISRSDIYPQRTEKRRGRKKHRSRRKREEEDVSDITPVLEPSSDKGRIPTPKLRSKSAGSTRHHLDRTTPVVGGAILSSPPRPEKSSQMKVSRSWCTPQDVYDDEVSTIVSSDRFQPVAGQSQTTPFVATQVPISTSPTFGLPSKDTHILRDDEVSVDKPLETVFVDSPAKIKPTIEVVSGGEKPARKGKKPTKFEPQQAIKEGYGQTYNKPMAWGIEGGMPIPRIDDDVLSLSARSVASSCSLASEVYERAQKRTKEFWGKDGIASR
ncbi:nuclear protein MDM1-like isoform X2 [Saccostrea echinata]|uniref:nuclear protein MDM1-like isoform X2 n=1 Tax=Saccostrea echinata TaxID=191078 RepID=UPI002A81D91F|nr:nuclear protein MDM1-like isoform X2 [Saccostrea echinata]